MTKPELISETKGLKREIYSIGSKIYIELGYSVYIHNFYEEEHRAYKLINSIKTSMKKAEVEAIYDEVVEIYNAGFMLALKGK